MTRLSKFLLYIILPIILAWGGFRLYDNRYAFFGTSCEFPVSYSLGSIDPEFGISENDFSKAVREAADLWEIPLKENLFEETRSGGVSINLVFDEREARTQKIKNILDAAHSDRERYDSMKSEYDFLLSQIDRQKTSYESDSFAYRTLQKETEALTSSYNARVRSYSDEVSRWNTKGGAPESEYQKLQKEKASINDLFSIIKEKEVLLQSSWNSLENLRQELNTNISQLNTVAGLLNRYAEKINAQTAEYERIPRDEFEAGEYRVEGKTASITIFQFSDNTELVEILGHELGHALGLDHTTSTEKAIMYPKMGGQRMELTPSDISLFKEKCGK